LTKRLNIYYNAKRMQNGRSATPSGLGAQIPPVLLKYLELVPHKESGYEIRSSRCKQTGSREFSDSDEVLLPDLGTPRLRLKPLSEMHPHLYFDTFDVANLARFSKMPAPTCERYSHIETRTYKATPQHLGAYIQGTSSNSYRGTSLVKFL
jgi:hypothetical protein